MSNPEIGNFLIKWRNKLDINDCTIQVLRGHNYEKEQVNSYSYSIPDMIHKIMGGNLKEIIIAYKSIHINTYNVICMDISESKDGGMNKLVFRHERYQLWESGIQGFLNKKSLDFVTANKDGISLLGLSSKEKPRYILDKDGQSRRLHSLESMNYLCLYKDNSLYFDCSKQKDRWVRVQQEYRQESDEAGEDYQTDFEQVYKIKIW